MTLNFQRNFLHGQKVSMSAAMIETGGGGVETDKNSRLLYLYEMLVHGEGLQKKEAAAPALESTSAASRGTSTACVIFLPVRSRRRRSYTRRRSSGMS